MNENTILQFGYFAPDKYINSLMKDIGFENAQEKEKDEMYKALSKQITNLITNAISLHTEPEQLEEALIRFGDLKDMGKFIEELVAISPEAQIAVTKALEEFYTETVETYEQFKG